MMHLSVHTWPCDQSGSVALTHCPIEEQVLVRCPPFVLVRICAL